MRLESDYYPELRFDGAGSVPETAQETTGTPCPCCGERRPLVKCGDEHRYVCEDCA